MTTITAEDRALIKPYVIMSLIKAAFERDSNVFLQLKTPDPYVDWLTQTRAKLSLEARRIKTEAYQRGIRITSNQRIEGGLLARYQCRGYFGDILLPDAEVAEEAAELMRRLLTF